MIFIDVVWLSLGVIWLVKFYIWVQIGEAKEIMLGMCICVSCFVQIFNYQNGFAFRPLFIVYSQSRI